MALTGEKGAIKTDENQITKMENWKLNIKANEVETTSFDDDGWESYEVSTKGYEVSMEGIFNKSDKTGQQAIMTAMASGASLPISLYIDKSASKADFTGNIKITGMDVEVAPKDKIKLSIKAKGTGKLTGLEESSLLAQEE